MWHNCHYYGPTTLVLFPTLFDWKISGIMELYLPVLPVPLIVPPSHSERCDSVKTKPIHSEFISFEFSWTAAAQLYGLLSARRIRVRPWATKYVPVPSDCNLASNGMSHFFKLRLLGLFWLDNMQWNIMVIWPIRLVRDWPYSPYMTTHSATFCCKKCGSRNGGPPAFFLLLMLSIL